MQSGVLNKEKKVTIMLPVGLLKRATSASGLGITSTLKKGLELVAAKSAYQRLLKLKGKLDLKLDLHELRRDR